MIPAKNYFLRSYVAAVVKLSEGNPETELELAQIFKAVGKSRPDLTERWRFAERGKKTVELEKLLDEALDEAKDLIASGKLPKGTEVPYLGRLRINHSTGKLHAGYGSRSVTIFD